MRRFLAFFLTLALLTAPAAAAWSDVGDHWASPQLDRAVQEGWLKGYDDGTLRPDGALTWGQYLTMLGRAFWPQALTEDYIPGREHWAAGALRAARTLGVTAQTPDLDSPLTRQEAAGLLYAALVRVKNLTDLPGEEAVLSDWDSLPETLRPAVSQLVRRGVVKGFSDGAFHGDRGLTRAEGVVLMARLADLPAEERDLPAPPPGPVAQGPQEAPPAEDTPGEEDRGSLLEEDPEKKAPPASNAAETTPGETTPPEEPSIPEDPALRELGENAAKRERLFGSPEKRRFSGEEEARAHMAQVTVPVWRLDSATGEKTASELTFLVHQALAGDMEAIFTEIFNDPEQFPIHDVGCYSWRGDSAKGEHNCGTALDINYMENYQIYPDGSIGAGSHWLPGEDPLSIPEDGSVVRIFEKYGYTWGGTAWPTNKDYMHFSYMGV